MLFGDGTDGFGHRAEVTAQNTVHFIIQNQLFGQVGPQGGVALVVLEDQLDLGTAQGFDPGVFGHGHIDVRHGIVGDFSGQLSTGPQLAAGSGRTTGQRIDDADFDCLLSQGPRRENHPDDQHEAQQAQGVSQHFFHGVSSFRIILAAKLPDGEFVIQVQKL